RRFLHAAANRHRLPIPMIAPEAASWLERHPWPGNVRELRNVIERALLLADDVVITLAHLPMPRIAELATASRDDPERMRTLDALARCHGNQTRAAKLLGVARSTFVKRLDLYGVPRPRRSSSLA